LSFRIFEQLALALKTEFALKFFKTGGAAAPPPRTPMPTHVQSKPSSDFTLLRHRLPKLVYLSCAHIWRGSYPILERLVDVCP